MAGEIQYWEIEEDDRVLDSAIEGMDLRAAKTGGEVHAARLEKDRQQVESLMAKAETFIGAPIAGTAADMGAGRGMLTALLSRRSGVEKVYAVEYSRDHVERLMPDTFKRAGAEEGKIVRCVGSFNKARLPDASLDFILEYGAYHHSENIGATVAETHRLLKPGGWFIGIDRSWPSETPQRELDKRLAKPLSAVQRELYNIPGGKTVTRADWGEHEYRDCDWLHFFAAAGFRSHIVPFRSFNRKTPAGMARYLAFRLFGDFLLARRAQGFAYYPWFLPGFNKALILCQKPELEP